MFGTGSGAAGIVVASAAAAATAVPSADNLFVPVGILIAGIGTSFAIAWRAASRWQRIESRIESIAKSVQELKNEAARRADDSR